jgi:hypothetical protein
MKWNFQKNLNRKRHQSLFIINNFFKGGIKMEEKITKEQENTSIEETEILDLGVETPEDQITEENKEEE